MKEEVQQGSTAY